MTRKPVVNAGGLHRPIETGLPPPATRWTFSFRFWQQVEYFGIGHADSKWFTSLFEKLQDISRLTVDSVFEDPVQRAFWRFHEINWNAKNCPIRRGDLQPLPAPYHSDEEHPFYQFQISKGLGRIVGFFDERWVFNVVLLDHLHNLQPSKTVDHEVRRTVLGETHYCALRSRIDKLRAKLACEEKGCEVATELMSLLENQVAGDSVIVVAMKSEDISEIERLLSTGKIKSVHDVFDTGLTFLVTNESS